MNDPVIKPVILLAAEEYENEDAVKELDFLLGDMNNDAIYRNKFNEDAFATHIDILYNHIGKSVIDLVNTAGLLNNIIFSVLTTLRIPVDTKPISSIRRKMDRMKGIVNSNLTYNDEKKNKILENYSQYLLRITIDYTKNIKNISKNMPNAIYVKDDRNLRVLLKEAAINCIVDSADLKKDVVIFIYSLFLEANINFNEVERDLNRRLEKDYIEYLKPLAMLMY